MTPAYSLYMNSILYNNNDRKSQDNKFGFLKAGIKSDLINNNIEMMFINVFFSPLKWYINSLGGGVSQIWCDMTEGEWYDVINELPLSTWMLLDMEICYTKADSGKPKEVCDAYIPGSVQFENY